jgi:hypothetical protein
MKRGDSRILTTHTGSLPRPADLVEALNAKELGKSYEAKAAANAAKLATIIALAIIERLPQSKSFPVSILKQAAHARETDQSPHLAAPC